MSGLSRLHRTGGMHIACFGIPNVKRQLVINEIRDSTEVTTGLFGSWMCCINFVMDFLPKLKLEKCRDVWFLAMSNLDWCLPIQPGTCTVVVHICHIFVRPRPHTCIGSGSVHDGFCSPFYGLHSQTFNKVLVGMPWLRP